jgi:DNA-binding PadR family transcriptional regulator
MKRQGFYLLVSLAGADRHGSGIMRDVLELTDGELRLWPATLYGTLDDLRGEGLIEELEDTRSGPAGESERKRYYRITAAGRCAVVEETRRLEAVVAVARERTMRHRRGH